MSARNVSIRLTNRIIAHYEARSYPHDDRDNNGRIELYKVPVYQIVVSGTNDKGSAAAFHHMAPRFMPYYNNPAKPDRHYSNKGWLNAGLSAQRTIVVPEYKPKYEVQNRYSPGRGAIVMRGTFYIHAGPADLSDFGFGSAGCVEIIGNYDDFKKNIATLSGIAGGNSDYSIGELVRARKLIVEIEQATVPNIKLLKTREVVVN